MRKELFACKTLPAWLRQNLGPQCLAPLTGADYRALAAAVQIIQLYSYAPHPTLLDAWAKVLGSMQATTLHLAYHATAHVMDWDDRRRLWDLARLQPAENSNALELLLLESIGEDAERVGFFGREHGAELYPPGWKQPRTGNKLNRHARLLRGT